MPSSPGWLAAGPTAARPPCPGGCAMSAIPTRPTASTRRCRRLPPSRPGRCRAGRRSRTGPPRRRASLISAALQVPGLGHEREDGQAPEVALGLALVGEVVAERAEQDHDRDEPLPAVNDDPVRFSPGRCRMQQDGAQEVRLETSAALPCRRGQARPELLKLLLVPHVRTLVVGQGDRPSGCEQLPRRVHVRRHAGGPEILPPPNNMTGGPQARNTPDSGFLSGSVHRAGRWLRHHGDD